MGSVFSIFTIAIIERLLRGVNEVELSIADLSNKIKRVMGRMGL